MPTKRVPTAVISVDSKMAVAMMAEPTKTDAEVPTCPCAIGRYP